MPYPRHYLYLQTVRERYPRSKIYLLSKSASSYIAVEAARISQHETPGLLEGLILMSPVVPSDPDLISQNKTNLAEVDKQAGTVTIPEIMDWRWRMAEQQSWFIENPFSSLRVFFCTGEVDTEVLAKERAHLTQFQAADPSRVFFTDYPSLGHDLALPNRKTNGQRHKLLLDLHCFLHGFLPSLP